MVELDAQIPELRGIERRPLDFLPPMPQERDGSDYVSFRFWQIAGTGKLPVAAAFEALQLGTPLGEEVREKRDFPEVSQHYTVVEAVTPVRKESDGSIDPSAAFDKCFNQLNYLLRAYQIVYQGQISQPVTKQTLGAIVPFVTADLIEGNDWDESVSILTLHANLPELVAPATLTQEDIFKVLNMRNSILKGHPAITFQEQLIRARHLTQNRGETGSGVIHSYIAVEVLIDELLSLLLWEDGYMAEAAADEFFGLTTSLAQRATSGIAPRLGGNWNVTGEGPIVDWGNTLRPLRNQVVHRGYQPCHIEAEHAFDIVIRVRDFARVRVGAKKTKYVKTAVLFLGTDYMEKKGLWSRRFRELYREYVDRDLIGEYSQWRQEVENAQLT